MEFRLWLKTHTHIYFYPPTALANHEMISSLSGKSLFGVFFFKHFAPERLLTEHLRKNENVQLAGGERSPAVFSANQILKRHKTRHNLRV